MRSMHFVWAMLFGFFAALVTSCGLEGEVKETVDAVTPCECACTDCECADGKDCFCQSCNCKVDPDDKDGDGKPDHEPGGGGCPDGSCPEP